MKKVIIPRKALDHFVAVAQTNVDTSGQIVETLAFLIGFIDEKSETIKATELLFPN
jgi:hypothetical protein